MSVPKEGGQVIFAPRGHTFKLLWFTSQGGGPFEGVATVIFSEVARHGGGQAGRPVTFKVDEDTSVPVVVMAQVPITILEVHAPIEVDQLLGGVAATCMHLLDAVRLTHGDTCLTVTCGREGTTDTKVKGGTSLRLIGAGCDLVKLVVAVIRR